MFSVALSVLLAIAAVISAARFSPTIWLAAYPIFFAFPKRGRLVGFLTLGITLDLLSAHPFGVATVLSLVLPSILHRFARAVRPSLGIHLLFAAFSALGLVALFAVARFLDPLARIAPEDFRNVLPGQSFAAIGIGTVALAVMELLRKGKRAMLEPFDL